MDRFDADAKQGNERVQRAAFIREEMRQTGCLAIEAARRWAALCRTHGQVGECSDCRADAEVR